MGIISITDVPGKLKWEYWRNIHIYVNDLDIFIKKNLVEKILINFMLAGLNTKSSDKTCNFVTQRNLCWKNF